MKKMKKFYVADVNELNDEEKRTGRVSYRRLIDRYIDDLVLCNNIENVDNTVFENMQNIDVDDDDFEIYQYYLCNLGEFEREKLIEYGVSLSYSELLDCDVLLVDHWGTSWDYVMSDAKWSENLDEC